MKNKHQSIKIRKKFRKTPPYKCCNVPRGNKNKLTHGYCCGNVQWHKRMDLKNEALIESASALYNYN